MSCEIDAVTSSAAPELVDPDFLRFVRTDGVTLLRIGMDGTVDGEIENMGEVARVFMAHLRSLAAPIDPVVVGNGAMTYLEPTQVDPKDGYSPWVEVDDRGLSIGDGGVGGNWVDREVAIKLRDAVTAWLAATEPSVA